MISKKIDEDAQESDTPALLPTEPHKPHQPKWEKRMKQKPVIRSLEQGPKCIMLPIDLKTTDTMEESSTKAIVDTRATGDFIDQDFVTQAKLLTHKLSEPIPVYNMDRTLNEAGSIHEVVDVIMTYNQHSECILLAVTRLSKQCMILGFTWLNKHNLEIDFHTQTIKMSRCLPCCCIGCQTNRKVEQNAKRKDIEWINACWTGHFPAFVEDADEEDKLMSEPSPNPEADFPDEPLEEGN